jgi:starch synthase
LADVCAVLPRALARKGIDVRILLPAYPAALAGVENARDVSRSTDEGKILRGRVPDSRLPIYLFDQPDLFRRPGGPYQDENRRDWPGNLRRYAAFCHAEGWVPDLMHVHDWHTAPVPALLALQGTPRPPTILTIHNLAYQGNFPMYDAAGAGLPEALFNSGMAEFYGQFSFLKAGIGTADRLTTVSPTYAREILTPEHGARLDGVLRTRANDLTGILNGVDRDVWNPASDLLLPHHYSAQNLSGKRACKTAVQRELGLEPAPDVPLVCFINRLTHQKMAGVVLELLPALAGRGIQFALHGEGDADLEHGFAAASGRFPNIVTRVGYREDLAHRLTAGADISAIPSRFEPCGLTALYAMHYGTLPVARLVGGLADSVVDADDAPMPRAGATGFGFAKETAGGLLAGLDRACAWFASRHTWHRMVRTAMERDFSWDTAARHYLKLYDEMVPGFEADDPPEDCDCPLNEAHGGPIREVTMNGPIGFARFPARAPRSMRSDARSVSVRVVRRWRAAGNLRCGEGSAAATMGNILATFRPPRASKKPHSTDPPDLPDGLRHHPHPATGTEQQEYRA